MCGIAGIFNPVSRAPVDPTLLRAMTRRIAHRGPDGEGYYDGPGVGLGHRRLSIIDVGGGQQPMFNTDRSICVVFNGEIYNYQELRRQLSELGHEFRTKSDTEVLIHGWRQWGEESVDRLRGMFAYALWDAAGEILFLARDRLGKKPIYHTTLADGTFLFGSELKSLLVAPGVSRTIAPDAVEDYFAFGYVPDPKCIFAGIAKLPPAHTLRVPRQGQASMRRYWRLHFRPRPTSGGVETACGELLDRLKDSVACRLVSEVPLGAFLSGGVDSSGVVALMSSAGHGAVRSIAVAVEGASHDESPYAEMVAQKFRTNHSREVVSAESARIVDAIAGAYDEPFGDSSAVPTYLLCKATRRHVTVALSGDGGDEVFAGYRRYLWHSTEASIRRALPDWFRGAVLGTLGRWYPKFDWLPRPLRAKTTLLELAADNADGYFHNVAVIKPDVRLGLYSQSFRRKLGGYRAVELVRRFMAEAETDDPLAAAQYTDLMTYLPGDILTKVDRASMAHGLEVRAPMLDHTFVEWSATLPSSMKLHDRSGKWILKKALESLLPHELLYRPKQGFSIPVAQWMRGDVRALVSELSKSERLGDSGFLDMAALRCMIDSHMRKARDASQAIWMVLMFDRFLRQLP